MVARELTEMILGHDTPLRLDEAAKIAFPRDGMTAAASPPSLSQPAFLIRKTEICDAIVFLVVLSKSDNRDNKCKRQITDPPKPRPVDFHNIVFYDLRGVRLA
jgi:hypothetical protein